MVGDSVAGKGVSRRAEVLAASSVEKKPADRWLTTTEHTKCHCRLGKKRFHRRSPFNVISTLADLRCGPEIEIEWGGFYF